MIEWISDDNDRLALVIRTGYCPKQTEFLTPDSYNQQVGFIVYKKDGLIKPHKHNKIKRIIKGTSEVLIVKKGKMEATFFSNKQKFVTSVIINEGDILLLINGGHSFRMIEDTILLEIKQGPFAGDSDKTYFESSLPND